MVSLLVALECAEPPMAETIPVEDIPKPRKVADED